MTTALAPTLTAGQQGALEQILGAVRDPSAVVTLAGLAGTGKTFLTRTILQRLDAAGWRVLLTAPTHQALRIAQQDLPPDVQVMTLHAALGLRVRQYADGSQKTSPHKPPKVAGFDLVVVDEASMVGPDLYALLMGARMCPVLFVGDPGQLPPVRERGETVEVLESPAFAEVRQQIHLTEIVRQAKGSATIALAHEVRRYAENAQRVPIEAVRPLATHQVFMDTGGVAKVAELIVGAKQEGYDTPVALAYRNQDVDRINRMVHAALYPDTAAPFVAGERILFRSPYHAPGREHEEPLARTNEYATVLDAPAPTEGLGGLGEIRLRLAFEDGAEHVVPVPLHKQHWNEAVDALFREHNAAKSRAVLATDPTEQSELRERARVASARAWSLRSALADVQHTYAMTTHRSQGSTFDIAVLFWRSFDYMRSDFEHARAIYVAATRPSLYLAIVE